MSEIAKPRFATLNEAINALWASASDDRLTPLDQARGEGFLESLKGDELSPEAQPARVSSFDATFDEVRILAGSEWVEVRRSSVSG